MPLPSPRSHSTQQKLAIFKQCFSGLPHVYGTYDPKTGRVHQVKSSVTDEVLLNHLAGRQPYGVYLLCQDRTGAVVADFDVDDLAPPRRFMDRAAAIGLSAYLERSKCKGYHAWIFSESPGVTAAKARCLVRQILMDIRQPDTEIFPKQDRLTDHRSYGNFINTPLFGRLVPQGRTVFLDPSRSFQPFADPWEMLAGVRRISEAQLDQMLPDLGGPPPVPETSGDSGPPADATGSRCRPGLLPCARRMLMGVAQNQRVVCFRLAIHLKRLGFPREFTAAFLRLWATQNRPPDGQVIQPNEVQAQVNGAYRRAYASLGCEDPIIRAFCDPACPVLLHRSLKREPPAAEVVGEAVMNKEPVPCLTTQLK